MGRIALKRHEFEVLHDAIVAQYEQDCAKKKVSPVRSPASKFYGFAKDEPYQYSIKGFMKSKPSIKKYLEKLKEELKNQDNAIHDINGKNLYNKLREVETNSPDEAIILSDPYAAVYFLYIDCKDVDDFREKYHLREVATYYAGYYYSQVDDTVKRFSFILYTSGYEHNIEVMGFQDGRRQEVFSGNGKIKNNNLFVNLEDFEGIEMKIIIPVDSDEIEQQNYLQGVLTTITNDNFPLSVRIFLARMDALDAAISSLEELSIKRFLILHRQTLRAPMKVISHLDNLQVRDEVVNNLRNIVGTYWIWRYAAKNEIAQIKMVIHEDYTVRISQHPLYRDTYAEQYGIINVSRIFSHNLCITTFPKVGNKNQLISFYMIELTQSTQNILKGLFATVGRGQGHASGELVLFKEENPREELQPCIITESGMEEHLRKYSAYPELLAVKALLLAHKGQSEEPTASYEKANPAF